MEESSLDAWLAAKCPERVSKYLGWGDPGVRRAALGAVRTKQFCELFCGHGGLVTSAIALGLRSDWFDSDLGGESMNLLTVVGFANAVSMCLRLQRGAVCWLGVPCSSFVFLSRGHTRRTQKKPLGNVARRDVAPANALAECVAFLIRLLVRRHVFFIVEQPASSLLWKLPALAAVVADDLRIGDHRMQRRFVWQGHFGHSGWKPTTSLGLFPELHTTPLLCSRRPPVRSVPSPAWTSWRDARKRKRVRGQGAALTATGHYPKRFCAVVARAAQLVQGMS